MCSFVRRVPQLHRAFCCCCCGGRLLGSYGIDLQWHLVDLQSGVTIATYDSLLELLLAQDQAVLFVDLSAWPLRPGVARSSLGGLSAPWLRSRDRALMAVLCVPLIRSVRIHQR